MFVLMDYLQGNILWLPVALGLQIDIDFQGLATQQFLLWHLNLAVDP